MSDEPILSERSGQKGPVWTAPRVSGAVFAVLLLGAGLSFLIRGIAGQRDFVRWQSERPLEAEVDLSKPGLIELPLRQTCSIAHGQNVVLQLPASALKQHNAAELLNGLDATLTITDAAGSNVVEEAALEIGASSDSPNEAICIFSFPTFHKGTFQAKIKVSRGAPALAGITQRIESRYLLCGLESMIANIALLLGFIGIGLGVVVACWVGWIVVRAHRRHLYDR